MVVQLLLVPGRLHKGMGPAHVDSFNLPRPFRPYYPWPVVPLE